MEEFPKNFVTDFDEVSLETLRQNFFAFLYKVADLGTKFLGKGFAIQTLEEGK